MSGVAYLFRWTIACFGITVAFATMSACAAVGVAPPVIHEPFTPLPCPTHPASTIALEGCYERQLLMTDEEINKRVEVIYGILGLRYRKPFAQSEILWLRYRRSSCLTQISNTVGGSGQPVRDAACQVARNRTHLTDLAALLFEVRQH